MTQKDLQELEQAARAIVAVVERNRVSDETAAERRAKFVLLPGGSNSQEQEESIFENSAVIFDEKEILKMPPEFRKIFKTQGVTAHVRMKGNVYEIRCQINRQPISGSSKDLKEAKRKFIEDMTKKARLAIQPPAAAPAPAPVIVQLPPPQLSEAQPESVNFITYGEEWLEVVKKPTVKTPTFEDYESIFNAHLYPAFGTKNLNEIKQFDVQQYLNALVAEGKVRAAHKHCQILKALFEYAEIDELIVRSPMLKIKLPYYEAENGQALTMTEEIEFVAKCLESGTRSGKAFIFILCTGLRRSELASAEIVDGKWVRVISAKQRIGRKERTRMIPISPRLKKLLPDLDLSEIKDLYPNRLSRTFKEWLPNHHLHELRHTFITRAQECGISRELVSLWAGHKADNTMTSNVYTHFSEEYQLQEIEKFDY